MASPSSSSDRIAADADDRERLAAMLRDVARGDQPAFEALYRRTSAPLFGVCLRMIRHRGDAEEVLQEVFTTIWRRADSFDPAKASAMTWLVTLTRNKAIDRLRQHGDLANDEPIDFDALPADAPSPLDDVQTRQEYDRLRECLDALEPHQQQSVREAFFSGATYNELATRCKVPLGTMKSWIRRGLLQLRACLES